MGRMLSVGAMVLLGVALAAPARALEKSEIRKVGSFERIELAGALDLVVKASDSTSVRLIGEREDLALVATEVNKGVLLIRQRDGNPKRFDWSRLFQRLRSHVACEVSVPAIKALTVSGMCGVDARGLKGDAFAFKASGATSATFEGKVKTFELELSGAGTVEAKRLVAEQATLDLSGASHVTVNATRRLVIDASGASEVTYLGSPTIQQNLSGASRIRAQK